MSRNLRSLFVAGSSLRRSSLLAATASLFCLGASTAASAATLCVNPGGTSGCKSTISAAVSAAKAGDVIEVATGVYAEQVTITQSLSMVAEAGASPVIEAKGLNNGIFINGMSAAPAPGVASVLISGFTVRDANFEGILVANADDVTIVGNVVTENNKSLNISAGTCPGMPAFETNEGDDCGEGIHLMGAAYSTVLRNTSQYNSGGILISDETGISHGNLIRENVVENNPYDCGTTMASHGPATSVIPTAKVSYGVINNTIANNTSTHNGYLTPGAGAGVGIFAPFPGTTASGNVVIDNEISYNGLPGVTMHNHASAPSPAPPVNLNNNIIVGNHIYGNAADTQDAATAGPTGINVYSVAPIFGTVVSQNIVDDENIAVAFKAPAGQLIVHFNDFELTGAGVENLGKGTVNATENWWNCTGGPGASGCTTVSGSGVSSTPWLSAPYSQ